MASRDVPRDVQKHGNYGKNKYNYKDSGGNKLSEGQKEFFKDSKVRDDRERPPEVYHPTDAVFNKYDLPLADPDSFKLRDSSGCYILQKSLAVKCLK